ncbi:MAG: 30S ribosome-binding factor RbfA [Sedimentisphaerales bacterium]|nr:30S ribosome-binding factor RbfA [Sedimentisphaerales bacterium]
MVSRRLEKVSQGIKTAVSEIIQSRLNDPRVTGIISVTRVECSTDLRRARVFLSIIGVEGKQRDLSFSGVRSAVGYIQSHLAKRLSMKVCPTLQFELDDSLQKGFEISRLIDQVSAELAESDVKKEVSVEEEDSESEHER